MVNLVVESVGGEASQWFKDGQPVAGQTSNTLSFAAQVSDAGRYFLRVSSRGGATDSESVDVVVTTGISPILTVHPASVYYDTTNSESLRLAGVAMEVARRRAQVGNDSATYQLIAPGAAPLGSVVPGTYTLTVKRGAITEVSRPFIIGYLPAIVPIVQPIQSQTVDLGQNIDLIANANAYAPVTYQWLKDSVPIAGATDVHYRISTFAANQSGSYRVAVTSSAGTTLSEPGFLDLRPASLPVILSQSGGTTVFVGGSITFDVSATGGFLRYQWLRNGRPLSVTTEGRFDLLVKSVDDAGTYTVVVANGSGSITSSPISLHVRLVSDLPTFVSDLVSQTGVLGGDVTLATIADGNPLPDRYQWRKNGVDIPGATDAELRLHNLGPADLGSYTVVAYNTNGSATSAPAVLTIDPSARLVNLATRASVGTGGNVLIAGFVIAGNQPRGVLVRAIGDQLSEFGVPGVLRNPFLKLFDAKANLIASSDDWADGSDEDAARNARVAAIEAAARETGAFPLRDDTRDGALIATLAPGNYTAQVSGAVNTTGVGLVEVYELGKPGPNRLINLSSRAVVGTGGNILIPGLTLNGQAPRRLLLRAVGPGLADFNVSGVLPDPVMTVFRGTDAIATNDNWEQQPGAADIVRTTAAVGGFALKAGSRDSALLLDLPPGSYTVQVAGVGGLTGVALVEVYEVTP
jgi:hypothetical protein